VRRGARVVCGGARYPVNVQPQTRSPPDSLTKSACGPLSGCPLGRGETGLGAVMTSRPQSPDLRMLGRTDIRVTPVAMGCWPITGITSIDVNERDSVRTLEAAFEAGITFFDTAYCYGFEGESERMIGRALGPHRDEIVVATKGGLHWENGKQGRDASPA